MNGTFRECCDRDCPASIDAALLPANWYRVSWGFMCWACPEHAEKWKQFDQKNREYEKAYGEAYSEAFGKWESAWEAEYEKASPMPVPPPSQPSI